MAGFQNISYDDRRTDVLKYNNQWFTRGFYNASSTGEAGTLTSANSLSARMTFTFPDPANAFYYYGIRRCCGGNYTICIDCNPDDPNFEVIDAVNSTDDGKNPPVILYSKNFDKLGIHNVTLANHNDIRYGKSQITLDRFELQVEDSHATQSGSATSTSSASTLTSTSTLASNLSSAVPTSTSASASERASASPTTSLSTLALRPSSEPSAATSSASPPPVGAIVGGVMGGLVAISLCLVIYLLKHLRWRGGTEPEHEDTDTTSANNHGDMSQRANHSPAFPLEATSTSHLVSREHPPRRETDAGRIDTDGDGGNSLATLPPEYEEIFSGDWRGIRES
ncbi:uncharacterized protein EV420DRAFT_818246 [Desarmillaria tabescens]|uniref:Uncharacterized protein n=1 Tax=Armillaria tabescens TaxID=1929756 RepID=A0AA39NII3_ARMTA|nr:uncharacterized protein EV420DRAFT_818246 [Desarmillaria tabescens]KAK0466254.1 hypothetical protein EV420DRAFT_818246 [Desarmillaria tabescens]